MIIAPDGSIFVVGRPQIGQNLTSEQQMAVARSAGLTSRIVTILARRRLHPRVARDPALITVSFRTPHALEFDSQGRLWVADRGNHRLEIVRPGRGNYLDYSGYQYGRMQRSVFITEDHMPYAIDFESCRLRHINFRNGVLIGPVDQDLLVGSIPLVGLRQPAAALAMTGEGVGVSEDGNVYVAVADRNRLSDAGSAFTKYVVAGM